MKYMERIHPWDISSRTKYCKPKWNREEESTTKKYVGSYETAMIFGKNIDIIERIPNHMQKFILELEMSQDGGESLWHLLMNGGAVGATLTDCTAHRHVKEVGHSSLLKNTTWNTTVVREVCASSKVNYIYYYSQWPLTMRKWSSVQIRQWRNKENIQNMVLLTTSCMKYYRNSSN